MVVSTVPGRPNRRRHRRTREQVETGTLNGGKTSWPRHLCAVDASVDARIATADEQIRVSEAVKRELDRRRRPGESYSDVIERVLDENRDLFAGFGAFEGTDRRRAMRDVHERTEERSREHIEEMIDARDAE